MLQMKITQTGKKVVYGPLSMLAAGKAVKVVDGGRTVVVTPTSIGKPFRVDGALMAYGYLHGGDAHSTTVGESLHRLGFH